MKATKFNPNQQSSYRMLPVFRRVLVSLIILIASQIATIAAPNGDTNAVWISARTNALNTGFIAGTGGITNPFYGDFDAIMAGLATNTTIHLLPGTHYTKGYCQGGDLKLKAGQRVIGSGIDSTTVKKDTNFTAGQSMEGVLHATYEAIGAEVHDLTADSSAVGGESIKRNGIGLICQGAIIRRVRAINGVGNLGQNAEAFALYAGAGGTGNHIEHCEVKDVKGDYTSGITLNGQGFVRGNVVTFPVLTNAATVAQAYTTVGSFGAVFSGNYSENGFRGFYSDTGSDTDLVITHNVFKNVMTGIQIEKSGNQGYMVKGVLIRDNVIEIMTDAPPLQGLYSYGIKVACLDSQNFHNISMLGNVIRFLTNGIGSQDGYRAVDVYGTYPSNMFNILVANNVIQRDFDYRFQSYGNVIVNNVDLVGDPLEFRSITSSGSHSINAIDAVIRVTATNATTTLTLHAAYAFRGKSILVINEQGGFSQNVSVAPGGGDTILPSSPVTVGPNTTARFTSNGVTAWIQN